MDVSLSFGDAMSLIVIGSLSRQAMIIPGCTNSNACFTGYDVLRPLDYIMKRDAGDGGLGATRN